IATRGVFEILSPGSSFTMTGGMLTVGRASGSAAIADLYLQPVSHTITGGTIEIGTGNDSQVIGIHASIPVFNLEVAGTSNTARLENSGLTMRGSLTINDGTVFNASGFNVNVAGDFTNLNTNGASGTVVGDYRARSTSQSTTVNGSINHQVFAGVAGNLTNIGNLVINNTF